MSKLAHPPSVEFLNADVIRKSTSRQQGPRRTLKAVSVTVLSRKDFRIASAHRLRDLIEKLGLTQVEAAQIMGVSKHVLRNWLMAENAIGTYALYRLSRAKGIDFNYIFLGDWSNLPPEVVEQFERELGAALEAAAPGGHQERERKREKTGRKS